MPAVQVYEYACLIPAGTAEASPVTIDLVMPACQVVEIDIRVPPGPSGVMGFALGSAGQQVLPRGDGQWIVTDDEVIPWQLDALWDSGSWQLYGYNTGTYDHTVYVRFQVIPAAMLSVAPAPAPLPASSLSSAVDTAQPVAVDAQGLPILPSS